MSFPPPTNEDYITFRNYGGFQGINHYYRTEFQRDLDVMENKLQQERYKRLQAERELQELKAKMEKTDKNSMKKLKKLDAIVIGVQCAMEKEESVSSQAKEDVLTLEEALADSHFRKICALSANKLLKKELEQCNAQLDNNRIAYKELEVQEMDDLKEYADIVSKKGMEINELKRKLSDRDEIQS